MSKYYLKHDDNNKIYARYVLNDGSERILDDDIIVSFLGVLRSIGDVAVIADSAHDRITMPFCSDEVIIDNAREFLTIEGDSFFKHFLEENGFRVDRFLNYRKPPKKKNGKILLGASISCTGLSLVLLLSTLSNLNIYENVRLPFGLGSPTPTIDMDAARRMENSLNFLDIENGDIDYDDYYTFAVNNYYDKIKKYSKAYGVDPNVLLQILVENRAIAINNVLAGGRYGLMGIEYSYYSRTGVMAYNFQTNRFDLVGIDENRLMGAEYHFRIACMIFQMKMEECHNNLLAAIQSMGTTEEEFREKIIEYGIEKYGEGLAMGNEASDYYFNLVIDNQNDLGWLDKFVQSDGRIYAYNVIYHIPKDTKLVYKIYDGNVKELVIKVKDFYNNKVLH